MRWPRDGYVATDAIGEADLVLLNTCHIREKAAEKVYSELGRIRELKAERARAGREMMIGVAGCVAQAEGEEIMRRSPAVDLVIGPQTYHRLPDVLRRARGGEKIVETDYAIEDKFEHLPAARRAPRSSSRGVTAFLTVQEGCDKFCTFCVVPYTRGSEVSRPVAQIVAEAERLADAGVREITLLGQNVNAWHGEGPDGDEWGLGRLLLTARRNPRPGAAALHHQPSARHGRRADRRASRPAGADALPASAGAVRLRPHPEGDEPPPHGGRLSRADRAHPRRAAGHRHVGRFHRRLSRRDRSGFRGDAASWCARWATPQAFSFKYSPRPGTPGADMDGSGRRKRSRTSACSGCRRCSLNSSAISPSRWSAATIDMLIEKPGREARPEGRPLALAAAGYC